MGSPSRSFTLTWTCDCGSVSVVHILKTLRETIIKVKLFCCKGPLKYANYHVYRERLVHFRFFNLMYLFIYES